MIRRLGKHWQQLHRLVYIAALAGVIHFYWLVKADIRRPVQYGFVLTLVLGYRLFAVVRSALSRRSAPPILKVRANESTGTRSSAPVRES
jgi:sulfoxide reductase heme-binding subunit YedZ